MSSNDIATQRASTVSRVKGLINNDLKEICRFLNLPVSGNKASLQTRIIDCLEDAMNRGDYTSFARIRERVLNRGQPIVSPLHTNVPYSPGAYSGMPHSSPGNLHNRPSLPMPGQRANGFHRVAYKQSPFYRILNALTDPQDLPEMPSNRNTVTIQVKLSDQAVYSLRNDSSMRVMLYCTTSHLMGSYDAQHDVIFPSQMEVKLNGDEVKSNYKGLKNKPGTTKPADLTQFVRKTTNYGNNLSLNYALTTKRYTAIVNLVKKASAEELTERVRKGRVISKERVVQEMISKAQDPDIVATSTIMSLKDPVSTLRIETPCRSIVCNHNQCFDASSFIQLQEQAPTWTCPICSKTVSYEGLAVDLYVMDILQRTSKSVDQVTIEPEGNWSEVRQKEEVKKPQARAAYDNDSDDELVEISDPEGDEGVPIKKDPGAPPQGIAQNTPPYSSRDTSMSRATTSGKRPSAVIDLTLSDDDEPPRPAKRQQSQPSGAGAHNYNSPVSLPDFRRPQQPPNIQLPHHRTPSFTQHSPAGQYRPYQHDQMHSPRPAPPVPAAQTSQNQQAPWPNGYSQASNTWRGSYPQSQWQS